MNCEVYNVETGSCSKCKLDHFLRHNTFRNECVKNCLITETEVLQTLSINSENSKSFTLDEIRVCQLKINNCKRGTYFAYVDIIKGKIKTEFGCIECDTGFHKILQINPFINSIPFDVEHEIGVFHRNLDTPYFTCGSINTPIDNCEFYLDADNGKSNLQ